MRYLITGGAGFIGTNFSDNLLSRGDKVIILDNFSKKGSHLNAQWLLRKYGKGRLKIVETDIRFDTKKLEGLVVQVNIIYHLAEQVGLGPFSLINKLSPSIIQETLPFPYHSWYSVLFF